MTDPQNPAYQVGDVANGYVLTENGWQPLPATGPTAPIPPTEYRLGDVANGYVLTENGWQSLPGTPSVAGTGGTQTSGAASNGSSSKKTLSWVIAGAVAVLLVVVIGAVAVARAITNAATVAQSAATSRSSASTPQAAQNVTFGETVSVEGLRGSGSVKVESPVAFQTTGRVITPERGQFVYVAVTVSATGATPLVVTTSDFAAITPDGQRIRPSLVVTLPANAPSRLSAASLNSGETITGSLAFDVPANTQLKIAFTPGTQVVATWA